MLRLAMDGDVIAAGQVETQLKSKTRPLALGSFQVNAAAILFVSRMKVAFRSSLCY